jgi:predicted double-glycine peptidase
MGAWDSPNRITDELHDLGYQHITPMLGVDRQVLVSQAAEGPLLTTVLLDTNSGKLSTQGNEVHAVVVTGVSPDAKAVRLNDPWVGEAQEMSMQDFESVWVENALYIIRP